MRPVLLASEVREWEGRAIRRGLVPSLLMENAGRGAAHLIGLHLKPRTEAKTPPRATTGSCVRCADEASLQGGGAVIVAGPGNNGGDAFVVARHLSLRAASVCVFEVASQRALSAEASQARDAWLAVDGEVLPWNEEEFRKRSSGAKLVVDGLLGLGLSRELSDEYRAVVAAMNETGLPIYALDIPTGLNSDTGEVMGLAVRAAHTITFGHLKRGLLTPQGHAHAGRITLSHIGAPTFLDSNPEVFLLEESDLGRWITPREPNGHKATAGRIVLIGGSSGYEGALRLAARAAFRIGAGVVSLLVHESSAYAERELALDTMTLTYSTHDEFLDHLQATPADALVVGPGLSIEGANEEFLRTVLERNLPTVLDAGALRLLPRVMSAPLGPHRVLTPHPGEAAALLGTTTAALEANRFSAIERLVTETGATVILKGSRTLVRTPGGPTLVSAMGSPSLSVAGSGDVLSGVLGGLLARPQGPGFLEKAALAVGLHGLAGESFEAESGDAGLLASELADRVLGVKSAILSSHGHTRGPV